LQTMPNCRAHPRALSTRCGGLAPSAVGHTVGTGVGGGGGGGVYDPPAHNSQFPLTCSFRPAGLAQQRQPHHLLYRGDHMTVPSPALHFAFLAALKTHCCAEQCLQTFKSWRAHPRAVLMRLGPGGGAATGTRVGLSVGVRLGTDVGCSVGSFVALRRCTVGASVGVIVGSMLGESVFGGAVSI